MIATGHSGDNTAEIFEVATGRRLALLQGHKAPVSVVLLFPDGKTVATASYDQAVKLWDLTTQRELMTLRGEAYAVFALTLSPDRRRLASAGSDGTIRLWDPVTGRLVAALKGAPGDQFIGLAFTPDGNSLASVTTTTLQVWRAPSLAEIDRIENKK